MQDDYSIAGGDLMAGLPASDRTIGTTRYRVNQLAMGKWLELQSLVVGVIGPALGELVAGTGSGGSGIAGLFAQDVSGATIGRAIHMVSTRADAATQARVLELLGGATRSIDPGGDDHFLGADHWPRHMAELAPFVAFALEVQFQDFFDGLSAVLPDADEATLSGSHGT